MQESLKNAHSGRVCIIYIWETAEDNKTRYYSQCHREWWIRPTFDSWPRIMTYLWFISSGLVPQGITSCFPFSLNRLRQGVANPEEAILRRAMIGSHAANEREKKNPDHESESIFSVSWAAAADHVMWRCDRQIFLPLISFRQSLRTPPDSTQSPPSRSSCTCPSDQWTDPILALRLWPGSYI